MAHTPGPWHVHPKQQHLVIGGQNVIATCEDGTDEDCANARLIAAAPDLLTAACNALQVARDPWNYTEMEQIALLDAVEAVIAKAEGRE